MAPFPYMPMLAIMASLVSYLAVQMSIFSYVGFMMEYLGVVDDTDKAGYFAGLLSSAFMIGRLLSAHFWGLVSDRYGCRFVMIIGLVSTVVLALCFGLSTTFAWASIFRFLLGLLNGVIGASKTLVSDVCGKEHETVGMGVVTISWSVGLILGPGVGGVLAEPAVHYPNFFSENGIFGRHPYLLPNVVGAGFALLALTMVLVFLKEDPTSDSVLDTAMAWYASWFHLDDANANEDIDDGGGANHTPREMAISELPRQAHGERQRSWMDTETTHAYDAPIGTRTASENHWRDVEPVNLPSLLAQKHIRVLLLIEALFSFVFTGFNEIYGLWALSTVARGGLDWSSVQIGKIFLASGFLVLVFEMFAVPNITPRVGFKMSQRLGSIFEIPVYVLLPLLSNLNADGTFVTATSIILVFMCYVSANSFYVGVALAFNNATVPERRGELNGISSGVASFSKAIAPIFCATLFAYSIDGDRFFPFDYHCAFYFIGAMRLGAAYMGWNRIRNEVTVEKFDIELIGLNWISDTEAAKVHDTDCIGLSRKNATELVENVPANPVKPNNRNDTRVVDMFGME